MLDAQDVIARRVAARIDGSGDLVAEVDRRLVVGDAAQPDAYDPATAVALAALIVNVAGLAWTIYRDLQNRAPQPAPQVLSRKIRLEMTSRTSYHHPDMEQVIAITVEEVTASNGPTV